MKMLPFLQLAAPEEKYSTAALAAGCVVILLTVGLLIGLLLCVRALRRPDVNRKCCQSFIFLTSGWFLHVALVALTIKSDYRAPASIAGMVLFGLFAFAAVVFAILGLSEVKREGPARKGRVPAVATLVLASLLVVSLVGAFVFGIFRGVAEAKARRAEPGRQVIEDLGYSIQPPAPWVQIDVKKVNALASAGYMRSRPQVYFMIIAEKLEPGHGIEMGALVEVIKGNLKGAAQDFKYREEGEETVNGLSGVRLVCDATIDNQSFTYRYWIHLSPQGAYQLIAWGNRADGAAVLAEAPKAFAGFNLVPPK